MLRRVLLYVSVGMSFATSGAVVYLLASDTGPVAVQPTPTVTVTATVSAQPPPSTAPLTPYYVNADTCLNIRVQPTTDSAVVECSPPRTLLQGTEFEDGWIKVRVASGWGYASATYLSTTPPAPPPPRPAKPRGSVTYAPGGKHGQGFPSGNCANWSVRWVNNSNTEVVQITFDPPSGGYHSGPYDDTGRTIQRGTRVPQFWTSPSLRIQPRRPASRPAQPRHRRRRMPNSALQRQIASSGPGRQVTEDPAAITSAVRAGPGSGHSD